MTELTSGMDAILRRYAEGPARLEAAIVGLSEAELDLAKGAGTWTIRQIVHHVVDGDDLWKMHIKAALGNSGGVFSLIWYWEVPQDAWAESWQYADRALEPSLALFRANRQHILQLMEQVPGAWERSIFLERPDGGKMQCTVGYTIEVQADHVMDHINDILVIRRMHDV